MVKSHRPEFTIAEGEALHYEKDEMMESPEMEKKTLLDKNLHFDKSNFKIIPLQRALRESNLSKTKSKLNKRKRKK
jgi:hypothetical protein